MTSEITHSISSAFENLSHLNQMVYDYWVSELYDDEGNMIVDMWNEDTLKQMETDVMYNS